MIKEIVDVKYKILKLNKIIGKIQFNINNIVLINIYIYKKLYCFK